jgi:hypothetical protein
VLFVNDLVIHSCIFDDQSIEIILRDQCFEVIFGPYEIHMVIACHDVTVVYQLGDPDEFRHEEIELRCIDGAQ